MVQHLYSSCEYLITPRHRGKKKCRKATNRVWRVSGKRCGSIAVHDVRDNISTLSGGI